MIGGQFLRINGSGKVWILKCFGRALNFFSLADRDIDRISAMKIRGVNQIHAHVKKNIFFCNVEKP
jgi:hypothetical protein